MGGERGVGGGREAGREAGRQASKKAGKLANFRHSIKLAQLLLHQPIAGSADNKLELWEI